MLIIFYRLQKFAKYWELMIYNFLQKVLVQV